MTGPIVSRLRPWSRDAIFVGWCVLAAVVLVGSQMCSTIWAISNPAPHHWDNAIYLNQAYRDYWAYWYGGPEYDPVGHPGIHRQGAIGVWDSILHADRQRPPGYRIVSLPVIYLGAKMLATLRSVSLVMFWLTLWVVHRTVRFVIAGPAGVVAGLLAAMLLGLYSEVGWSIRVYGTEYTLYFSTALMLLCLTRATRPQGRTTSTWIGLGLALGLGVLSKLTFVLIAGPACGMAGILVVAKKLPGITVGRLLAAAGIGALMAYPYYRYHLFEVLNYAQEMTHFDRHALHATGLTLVRQWVGLHVNEGMGIGAAITVAAAGVVAAGWFTGTWAWRGWFTEPADRPARRPLPPAAWAAVMAVAAGLPLPVVQLLFSSSDNTRHITPAYFPLTTAVAIGIGATGLLSAWWSWPVLIALAAPLLYQVHDEYVPMTNTPDDVWDWEPLHEIVAEHGLRFPYIGHVGNYGQFCQPAIERPWTERGDTAFDYWLWQSGQHYSWDDLRARMDGGPRMDVILTAPGFMPPKDQSRLPEPVEVDNSHNDDVAERLSHDPAWLPPRKFEIGRVHKATIWVFVRAGPMPRPKK